MFSFFGAGREWGRECSPMIELKLTGGWERVVLET
jgi:hypothetical protein